jgi:hypothetical protein
MARQGIAFVRAVEISQPVIGNALRLLGRVKSAEGGNHVPKARLATLISPSGSPDPWYFDTTPRSEFPEHSPAQRMG